MFLRMTQYSENDSHTAMPLEYLPVLQIYYVVGTAEGGAQVKWRSQTYTKGKTYMCFIYSSNDTLFSALSLKATTPSGIHPDLRRLSEGETKIIVEYVLGMTQQLIFHLEHQPAMYP